MEPRASMVDLAFALAGKALPRDHRRPLGDAVASLLPWLADTPGAGVHELKVVAGHGEPALLSQRARLLLRVPRDRLAETAALAGRDLEIGGHRLRLGAPALRELLPHPTLYAGLVASAADIATDDPDELRFLDAVAGELDTLGIACQRICGSARQSDSGEARVAGFALMLHALSPADSLRVLERGLGPHRHLGCGLFVPHRNAAAVGA